MVKKKTQKKQTRDMSLDQFIQTLAARDNGRIVNEDTAMSIAAVWQAVRLKTHGVASLPLQVFERDEKSGLEKVAFSHRLNLLFRKPNKLMTQYKFIETMQKNLELTGNAYAEIQRNNAGFPIALWPIPSKLVSVEVIEQEGIQDISYRIQTGKNCSILLSENIIHVKGLSTDGIVGLSKLRHAMDSMSVNLAATKYGANFFQNQARPSGLITIPNTKQADIEKVRKDIIASYSGLGAVGGIMVAPEGFGFTPFDIKPEEAQFLQTRKFSNEEIANWFGLRAYMLTGANSAFSNIAQQQIDFHTYSIRPECINWEQELDAKLLVDNKYSVKFNMDSILRADPLVRLSVIEKSIQIGLMTLDEARKLENLPPLPSNQQGSQ